MSKMMVKRDGLWTPMANLKGDTGPLPADNSVTNDALVTDGAKTNTAYLMGNRWTKDAEGELISVDDSYSSAALSLTVDGKSTQLTTTGKNLLDVTSYTAQNARIDANGNVTSVGGWYVSDYMDVQGMSSIARSGFNSNAGVRDAFYNSEKELLLVIDHSPSVVSVPSDAAYMRCSYLGGSDRVNGTMQYEQGTASTTYEPYTNRMATPCPDYPQSINSIDDPMLETRAKNLFPASTVCRGMPIIVVGGQCSVSDAIFSFKASYSDLYLGSMTVPGNSWTPRVGVLIPVSYGNAYLFELSNANFTKNFITWYSEDLVCLTTTSVASNRAIVNVPNERIKWASLRVGNGSSVSGTTYETTIFFGVAENSEPYSGGTSTLLPESTSLRSLPDGTKDELYLTYLRPSSRPGWAWYDMELKRNVGNIVIDGDYLRSRNNYRYSTFDSIECPYFFTYSYDNEIPSSGIGYVSNMQVVAANKLAADTFAQAGVNARIRFCILPTRFGVDFEEYAALTQAQRKELVLPWFDENPIEVVYKLATPITTQLDPIELPIMQAGTTNIWTDPSTSLSVTYERDRNIVISKLEAAAADLATS